MSQEKGSSNSVGGQEIAIDERSLQERVQQDTELQASVRAAKKTIEDLCENKGYGVSVDIKVWDRALR